MSGGLRTADRYPASWRAVADLPLFADEDWHRAMAGRLEGAPAWLWTADADGPVAGVSGCLVADPAAYRLGNLAGLLADPASPLAPAPVREALAAAALDRAPLFPHLLLTHPGYASFAVGRAAEDPAAVRRLLAAVLGWAREQGVAAVAVPYAESHGVLAAAARGLGLHGPVVSCDALLTLRPGGFAGYLAGLPADRRRRLRAERRALHARGLRGRRVPAVDGPLLERLTALRCQQRDKYGLHADPAAERARLERTLRLGDRADVFVVERAGAGPAGLLSFGLLVRDRDTWHALYTGSDYTDPASRSAYFEALFYAPVEAAAGAGIRRISYGPAASEGKRLRGCRLVPLSCLAVGLTDAAESCLRQADHAWAAPAPAPAPGAP